MGALDVKSIAEAQVPDVPPDTPQKTPKPSKTRRQRTQATQEQPLAGSLSLVDDSIWTWRSLTESAASKVPPIFTKDGRCVIVVFSCALISPDIHGSYFLSAAGPAVKIYSVATGSLVSTLSPLGTSSRPAQPTGYGDAITSMALNPHNAFQLYTASCDGCVRVWDLVDAILLQTVDVAAPIMHIAVHEKYKDEVYLSISRGTKINRHGTPTLCGRNTFT